MSSMDCSGLLWHVCVEVPSRGKQLKGLDGSFVGRSEMCKGMDRPTKKKRVENYVLVVYSKEIYEIRRERLKRTVRNERRRTTIGPLLCCFQPFQKLMAKITLIHLL